jgi:hypothetical protein
VAQFGVDGPAGGGAVGHLPPAAGTGPGQRRVAAAAGQLLRRVRGPSILQRNRNAR